jgi:hypothetical protein
MSRSSWVVIWVLLALGIGVAVYADKGSWINAVVTGQCNACPAPPQCRGTGGRGVRGGLPSVDGCGGTWWRRHASAFGPPPLAQARGVPR